MVVNNVPQNWNHAMPAIAVANVTAIGNPGNDKLLPPVLNKGQNNQPQGSRPQGSATEPAGSGAKSGAKPQ
jgi:hypothetical protein